MKFFHVNTLSETMEKIKENIHIHNRTETIQLWDSLGRILSEDLYSVENLPNFPRSTVDGYAVKASDTFGASETMPAFLQVSGSVKMGEETDLSLFTNDAIYVPTGAMLPKGSDAVVMIEYVEDVSGLLNVFKQVAPCENVVGVGEDIKENTLILSKGHVIRPQDVVALAANGFSEINVFSKIRIGYLSTGDEIVPHDTLPLPIGSVRDSNAFSVKTISEALGCEFIYGGIIKDCEASLQEACQSLISNVDMLVMSGGSSVGAKDYSVDVLDSLGSPGVFIHGISIKPGKPTIIGSSGGKPILGLPGHPASAMVIFKIVGTALINRLLGRPEDHSIKRVRARWSQNIPSSTGRRDYVRVSIEEEGQDLVARPIFGKSAMISTLMLSDGLAEIKEELEGMKAGEYVDVILFS